MLSSAKRIDLFPQIRRDTESQDKSVNLLASPPTPPNSYKYPGFQVHVDHSPR
jgi:hypothetical protein